MITLVRRPTQMHRPFRCRAIPQKKGRSDGFTLVETMVAVFLLTIGLLGVSQVFTVSSRHTMNSRKETVANSLAQEIREKILSESFDDIVSIFDGVDTGDPSSITSPASDWANHLAAGLGPDARGTVQVDTPDEDVSLSQGMVGVTVTIYWLEAGRSLSLPVRFAVAKIGV